MTITLITTWHLFGDGWDEWYNTIEEASREYDRIAKDDPNANLRLYEDTSEKDGDMVEENYVTGQNGFPY